MTLLFVLLVKIIAWNRKGSELLTGLVRRGHQSINQRLLSMKTNIMTCCPQAPSISVRNVVLVRWICKVDYFTILAGSHNALVINTQRHDIKQIKHDLQDMLKILNIPYLGIEYFIWVLSKIF